METLEVHAKDFLVKWVNAPDNGSITWQVKALKKSINFAIYQKNDSFPAPEDNLTDKRDDKSSRHTVKQTPEVPASTGLSNSYSRLRSNSVTSVNPVSSLSTFKNRSRSSTFSNSLSNSGLTLVKDYRKLLPDELVRGVYDTEKGGTFAFIFDNTFSKTTGKKVFFSAKSINKENYMLTGITKPKPNYKSIQDEATFVDVSEDSRANILWPKDGELMQGILHKKRRKKLQGFTKRFFILNFKYGTLSYFKTNDNKLRGQMPIPDSIISADSKSNQIFIDSGMEVWNLKAANSRDFKAWIDAFSIVKKRGSLLPEPERTTSIPEGELSLLSKLRDVDKDFKHVILQLSSKSPENLKADLEAIRSKFADLLESLRLSDVTSIISDSEFFDANENLNGSEFGVVIIPEIKQTPSDDEPDSDNDVVSEDSSSESDRDSEDLLDAPTPVSKESSLEDSKIQAYDLYPLPIPPIDRKCDIPVCDHYPPSLLSFVRKNVGKDLSSISMPVDMNEPITILQKYGELLEYSDLVDNALQGDYSEDSGEMILRVAAFAISYLSSMRMKVRSSRKPFNPLLGETYELVREDKGFRMLCEKVSHRPAVFAMFAEAQNWTLSFSPSPSQKFWGKTSEFYTSGSVKLTIRATGEVFTWTQPTCVLKNIIAGEKFTEPSSSVTVKSSTGQRAVVEFAKGGMFSGRSEEFSIKAFDSSKNLLPYSVSGKWTESMTLKTHSTEKVIWTAGELLPQCEKKFGFTKYAGSLNKITSIEEGKIPHTDSRFRPDMRAYENGNVQEAEVLKKEVEEGQRMRRAKLEESGTQYKPLFFRHVGGDAEKPDSGEWVFETGPLDYWQRRKNQNWDGIPKLW